MSDYIERDVAIDAFCSLADALNSAKKKQPFTLEEITIRGKISGIYLCKGIIRTIHSTDVAPVRHGRWKPFDRTYGRSIFACSECGECTDVPTEMGEPIFGYCPNCGAKMDKENEQ